MLAYGLHDAVRLCAPPITHPQYRDVRTELGNRAVNHYQQVWAGLEKRQWTTPCCGCATRAGSALPVTTVNALLWADPDEAVRLLPRFCDGLSFDRPLGREFAAASRRASDAASPIGRSYANLLRQMEAYLKDIGFYDEPGAAVGRMVDRLLHTPDLEPLYLAILNLWLGDWLVQEKRYADALKAYLSAEKNLPAAALASPRDRGGAVGEVDPPVGPILLPLKQHLPLAGVTPLETVPRTRFESGPARHRPRPHPQRRLV
ncbi:MAG: hypothetical protein U0401_23205 [Anaerolineae bacterium]